MRPRDVLEKLRMHRDRWREELRQAPPFAARFGAFGAAESDERVGEANPIEEESQRASGPVRLLSAGDVDELGLTIGDAVTLVEKALREQALGRTVMPPKTELSVEAAWFLHAMPAVVPTMGAGLKWVSYNPANRDRQLPNSSALLILNDLDSGLPYCVLDALSATYLRTAACAIVAMRYLANPIREIALVGAGQMAEIIAPYIDDAFPELERFNVLTRSQMTAAAFCEHVSARLHSAVRPARDADDATASADVVISAIGEPAVPPLSERHFGPGKLALALDGENAWTSAAIDLADKAFADDATAFANGFRHRRPSEEPPVLAAELADVVGGKAAARESADERIFCSNNGIAILDIVLGAEIFRRATAAGVGTDFPL
jgi:ornithine cyclodeaminase/alanine dehydrogenase-like protein (mu-crystallin family)